MPRATNAPAGRRRRKKVLVRAKGFRQGKSKQYRRAREFGERALTYAFRDRRNKKRDFRRLWITRISAACAENQISYHEFIHAWNKSGLLLNRKSLSEIAFHQPDVFAEIVKKLKGKGCDSAP